MILQNDQSEDRSKISDISPATESKGESQERVRLYRTRFPPESETESYPLDPNHTHFLLLEDQFGASDKKWRNAFCNEQRLRADLILPLRTKIEQESRKISQQGRGTAALFGNCSYRYIVYFSAYTIPIVQILVDGGVSSILNVSESIKAGTPIIVIDVSLPSKGD